MDDEIVKKNYVGIMNSPVLEKFYEFSGYMNVGYWDKPYESQLQACDALMERLTSNIKSSPNKILDVACGLGATTNFLTKKFPQATVTGLNISDHQIEICKRKFSKLNFTEMGATNLL